MRQRQAAQAFTHNDEQKDEDPLVSIYEIMQYPDVLGEHSESRCTMDDRELILTHKDIVFADQECSMILLHDVSSTKKLEKVQT